MLDSFSIWLFVLEATVRDIFIPARSSCPFHQDRSNSILRLYLVKGQCYLSDFLKLLPLDHNAAEDFKSMVMLPLHTISSQVKKHRIINLLFILATFGCRQKASS